MRWKGKGIAVLLTAEAVSCFHGGLQGRIEAVALQVTDRRAAENGTSERMDSPAISPRRSASPSADASHSSREHGSDLCKGDADGEVSTSATSHLTSAQSEALFATHR